MGRIDDRLAELEITLPEAPKPVAAYVPSVRSGNLLFVSGQVPLRDGTVAWIGPVPSATTVDEATAAARQCVLNGLAVTKAALDGDLDRVRRIVRVGVFVFCDPGFDAQPAVGNGASKLLVEVFGEAGRHARAAVGAPGLPLGASVEVDFVIEVD